MSQESSLSSDKSDSDWWLEDGLIWAEGGTPVLVRTQQGKNNIIYGRTRGVRGAIEVLLNVNDTPIPQPKIKKPKIKKRSNKCSDAMVTQQLSKRIDGLECKLDCIAQDLQKFCEEKNDDEEEKKEEKNEC